ncbi:MAG: gliding motility protein GldL [Flavobacteriaceae bacterium]|nr:gliding motility protein GldL [Flavobacteriaceae bacterium]
MTSFFGTKRWKRISQFLYSWGAAVVILGVLFKLTHFSLGPLTGELMLWVGLLTEAFIFFISGFEPPHKEYDWSLVYPELVGLEGIAKQQAGGANGFAQLNELLASANIDANVMGKLGEGINRLESTASKLNDISDASLATAKYTKSMNSAADAVASLTKTTQERLNSQTEVQNNMSEVMQNLSVTLENSKAFKKQTDELAQNMAALNKVYGNMLSAMNVSK